MRNCIAKVARFAILARFYLALHPGMRVSKGAGRRAYLCNSSSTAMGGWPATGQGLAILPAQRGRLFEVIAQNFGIDSGSVDTDHYTLHCRMIQTVLQLP
jgi:hypothetical protein